MMDVSDGLFLDASRMAEASSVTLSIEVDAVPHSDRFRERAAQGNQLDVMSKGWPMRTSACRWGDDYALLFTAPRKARLPVDAKLIGQVTKSTGSPLLVDGKPPRDDTPLGYQH